jgi:hypothetical protein
MTSVNQTIGINDNMIQKSPPLALMAMTTLMSTCRQDMLYINSHQSYQYDYFSPLLKINHINVTISPPFTSMEKDHSPRRVAPPA